MGMLILTVHSSSAPVLPPLFFVSCGMSSLSNTPLSREVSVPHTPWPMLNAPVLFTCMRSASTVKLRGTTSPISPAPPSKGAAFKIHRPVRSASTPQVPSGVSPQPAQPEQPRSASSSAILIVVFGAKVRDELFPAKMPERVLELHQLDEQVVL